MKYLKNTLRHFNILYTGGILLIVFCVVIFLLGRIVNSAVNKMNRNYLTELCNNHYDELQFEFDKTRQVSDIVCELMTNGEDGAAEKIKAIIESAKRLDYKISKIWIVNATDSIFTDYREDVLQELLHRGTVSKIFEYDTAKIWNYSRKVKVRDKSYVVGIDILLTDLHKYFLNNRIRKSYAVLFNSNGEVLAHPDISMLGNKPLDDLERKFIDSVIRCNEMINTTMLSSYLEVDVESAFFPLNIGTEQLVCEISVPRISIDEYMSDLQKYSLYAAFTGFVLLLILMVAAQRWWSREYRKRQFAEKESAQMQLKQIINQVNPHFLFNSLNSLYSLIPVQPVLAREFVLKLSGVYRYILEQRKETLSTVKNELEVMEKYFFLQKIRFEDQIELSVEINAAYLNYLIPAMSLQTLIENAIKHNKITPDNPLCIRVFIKDDADVHKLVIENNYSPRVSSLNENGEGGNVSGAAHLESTGLGLEMIRSVYDFYTPQAINIFIQDQRLFICELPLLPPPLR